MKSLSSVFYEEKKYKYVLLKLYVSGECLTQYLSLYYYSMLQLELHCCNEGSEKQCYGRKGGVQGGKNLNTSVVNNTSFNRPTHLIIGQSSLIFVLITLWATICLPSNLLPNLYWFFKYSLSLISQHLHTLNVCILSYNYLGINFIFLFLRFKSIVIK